MVAKIDRRQRTLDCIAALPDVDRSECETLRTQIERMEHELARLRAIGARGLGQVPEGVAVARQAHLGM